MNKYKKDKKLVCIIGLGHIGLPMACVLANVNYSVIGVDKDIRVLNKLRSMSLDNPEPGLQDLLIKAMKNYNMKLSFGPSKADIYIITVPTPLDSKNQPDISDINDAVKAIKPFLEPGNLVLIESTCPIGTTENIAKDLSRIIADIHIVYCPERVIPGNILYELIHNDRVVGGVDNASTEIAANFYRSFITGVVLTTDAKTAEAVKLAENAYRDINIAYANELSMILDPLNINTQELIRLANRHPRVNILQPGAGVGGHCIAVDPWFLVSAAPHLATLTAQARAVNSQKTTWVIDKITKILTKNKISTVACLGLTYKANVSDIRGSPGLFIVKKLKEKFHVLTVDPYVIGTEDLGYATTQADAIIILVAHDKFLDIPPHLLEGKILLDFAGALQ